MKTSLFDYDLPSSFIAQAPVDPRDASRLLVVRGGRHEHRRFRAIGDYLEEGDLLVLNDTKVFPARLLGSKEGTGGRTEVLLTARRGEGLWEAMVRGRVRKGTMLVLGEGRLRAIVEERTAWGGRVIRFETEADLPELLEKVGLPPLPPYIRREGKEGREQDLDRYQTVFAREAGAVAAPTAGLHFTEELLEGLGEKGVRTVFLTLHVGVGTFRPVKVDEVAKHRMLPEFYRIPEEASREINAVREEGRRLLVVGTTSVRALEAAAGGAGRVRAGEGWTDLFIRPPYRFRVVRNLLTNFHLPRSTLLMLVSALAGRERLLALYEEAKREGYRFYSYGDAMLILE